MDDSKLSLESNLTAGRNAGRAISFYILFNTAAVVNLFNGDAELAPNTRHEPGLPTPTDQMFPTTLRTLPCDNLIVKKSVFLT